MAAMAAGAGLLLAAGAAQASVTVIGGGAAEDCSKAAVAGERDARYDELCTIALQTELLSNRDRAGTYVNRGILRLRREEWRNATNDFDRAVRLQPEMGEAYVNRGAAAVGQARYADSLADLNRAIELGLQEPEKAYYNRALAHEGLDDMRSAYFDYLKAQELKPDWTAPAEQLRRFTVSRR